MAATRTRRVLLPGYIGIADDLHTLEAPGYGDTGQLAKAHQFLLALFNSPPRAPQPHRRMPYQFPAGRYRQRRRGLKRDKRKLSVISDQQLAASNQSTHIISQDISTPQITSYPISIIA